VADRNYTHTRAAFTVGSHEGKEDLCVSSHIFHKCLARDEVAKQLQPRTNDFRYRDRRISSADFLLGCLMTLFQLHRLVWFVSGVNNSFLAA
jgi:hypothetical protein